MFYIEIIFHWLYFFSFIPVVGITEGSYRLRKSWGFLGIFFKMVSNYLNMLRKRVFYTLLGGKAFVIVVGIKAYEQGI